MGRILALFFLVSVCGFLVFSSRGKAESLLTPVPKVYGADSKAEKSVNTWFPKGKAVNLPYSLSNLSASTAYVVNFDSGEVLYSANEKEKLPAASTIKIMTAHLVLKHSSPSDVFVVSEKAAGVGEDSMGLTQGEKLTVRELLYGLMLVSGNDAAITIAEGVAGSEEAFVQLMNQEAVDLGMKDTKFINSTGLDVDDQSQYTTAYDMAVLAHFVWDKYPVFREISSTENRFIDENSSHKAFDLYNQTNLLTSYPGVKGIKPGFTWNAGLCLVTYAENDGKKLLAVVLGSSDRRGEMKELLDLGFGYYGITVSHPGLDLQAE